jgi:hypothetical protein
MRITILFISCFISSFLFAPSASAIPMAGDYVFESGPNISGGFTSTGGELSAWSFSSNLLSRVFLNQPSPITLSWSSATDVEQPGNVNNTERFITNNASVPGSPFSGHYAQLIWNFDRSILNATFRVDATCCDAIYSPPPTVSFVLSPGASIDIPDNATVWFLTIGLLGLAISRRFVRQSW